MIVLKSDQQRFFLQTKCVEQVADAVEEIADGQAQGAAVVSSVDIAVGIGVDIALLGNNCTVCLLQGLGLGIPGIVSGIAEHSAKGVEHLCDDAAARGLGHFFLVQHCAGSGQLQVIVFHDATLLRYTLSSSFVIAFPLESCFYTALRRGLTDQMR